LTCRARSQAGQATTEFVVLCLALVPLVLIMPLVGKYIDMMHTAEGASRYVAFEGAVHHSSTAWKSDVALAEEVRGRFFSGSNAAVRSGDIANDAEERHNPLWRDHAGRPLLHDFESQVSVTSARVGFNFHGPSRLLWRGELDLPDDNMSTGIVTVRPRNVPGLTPFDAIDLQISRRTALLVDSWAAGSVAQVRDRIRRSAVVYPMGQLDPLVEQIGKLPETLADEPLRPGLPDWDRVPCDRLEGGC
jgi:hypothetical protein